MSALPIPAYKARTCAECQDTFTPRRHDQINCSPACLAAGKNRELVRGKQAYRALYHWVACPVSERGAFATVMGQIAREWRDEDRREGRGKPGYPEVIQTRRMNGMSLDGKRVAR